MSLLRHMGADAPKFKVTLGGQKSILMVSVNLCLIYTLPVLSLNYAALSW